ncbi:hypothetical protein BX659_14511 [Orenia metallireducens]|uniref:Uncharacterized protein n=1 Tax=Orenia metallireducens TaxID=1413210 RepID=A0A285IG05_9FIRM|nr:hypothetical protein [Orenia metallireducens]PRX18135.1 hypothetical protein BX659_14511 [Orenia metallireducens]SNY46905.1 hypothetical protein SAMN06265827_14611 [Orenia metallireducens]
MVKEKKASKKLSKKVELSLEELEKITGGYTGSSTDSIFGTVKHPTLSGVIAMPPTEPDEGPFKF